MTKQRTTSPPWSGQPAGPLGSRPPQRPDLPLIIVRLVFALCLFVLLLRGPALSWATTQQLPADMPTAPAGVGDTLSRLAAFAGVGLRALYTPPGLWALGGLVVLGLLALALELAANAVLLVVQRYAATRVGHSCFRLRVPQPLAGRGGQKSANGDDFFRAVHRLLPHYGAQTGQAPWLTLTLGSQPDEPVEFGLVLSGGRESQRTSWGAALRKIMMGLDPGALVDEQSDPLLAAVQPGSVVLWREYTLFHPPSYPLRLPDDTQGDLLGPIVAAVRGRTSTRYSEYSVTVRPRHDWDLTNGWRVYALRRLLQLRARHQYYLNPDMQALQDKIDSPAYDVTVRLTVVVESRRQVEAAQAELDELGAILLGQYQARSGTRLQRLQLAGGGALRVSSHNCFGAIQKALRWLVAGGAAAIAWLFSILVGPAASSLVGSLAVLPEAPAGQDIAIKLLPWVLAVSAGLAVRWSLQRRQGEAQRLRLRQLSTRAPRALSLSPLLLPCRAWRTSAILSAAELGGLWHLPTPAMGALVRWLPCRFLPAPPHAFVAAQEGQRQPSGDPRITVGHALRSDGTTGPVGPTLRDLRQIVHLTAGMGAGKSRLLANICQQLLPHGFILADGKGDDDAGSLVATVRQIIPGEVESRLVILDVLDTDWPIGINPLSGIDLSRPGGVDMALGQVLAIFGRLDPEVWAKSMGMQQYIRMGALLVLEAETEPTMAHIKQALMDDSYRSTLLQRCTNIEVRTFWQVTFPKTGEQQTVSLDALLRRFDNLLATETTRYLLTQPVSTFEFRRAMDDGLVVLVPMPDMTLGGMASLVGMLALQAIVRAAFQRSGSDQSRTTCPVIIDEFQVFLNAGATEDVSTAITRLRSLGIGGIYAHQSLTQLGDLKDVMLINAQSRIVLKTQEPDASVYGRQYAASGLTAIDIANQDANEHQYAVLQCAGQAAGPLSMRPLPWPAPTSIDVLPAPAQPWQRELPTPAEPADTTIARLVYQSYSAAHFQRLVAGLAALPTNEWEYLVSRWREVAAAQRAHLLTHPGCIPDRLERQRWLSRLWAALPRVLVAAVYQRQRWMVTPGEPPVRVSPPRRVGRGQAPQVSGRSTKDPSETWGYAARPAQAPVGGLPDDNEEA